MDPIITERLILRELELDDAAFILEIVNSDGWLKYIGDRDIRTIEDAKTYILGGPIHNYLTVGYGFQLMELKDSKIPVGMCGIIKRNGLESEDLGFALLPEHQGKGYAYEAASATIEEVKKRYGINHLLAITSKKNASSIKLLKKLKFTITGTLTLPNETEELYLLSTAPPINQPD